MSVCRYREYSIACDECDVRVIGVWLLTWLNTMGWHRLLSSPLCAVLNAISWVCQACGCVLSQCQSAHLSVCLHANVFTLSVVVLVTSSMQPGNLHMCSTVPYGLLWYWTGSRRAAGFKAAMGMMGTRRGKHTSLKGWYLTWMLSS